MSFFKKITNTATKDSLDVESNSLSENTQNTMNKTHNQDSHALIDTEDHWEDELDEMGRYWLSHNDGGQLEKAKNGNVDAQFTIGNWYAHGENDFPLNLSQAMAWYEKAAINGHSAAQYELGRWSAFNGDMTKAVAWYLLAAKNGHEKSIDILTQLDFKWENTHTTTSENNNINAATTLRK